MATDIKLIREPPPHEKHLSASPYSLRGYRIADVCRATGLGRTSVYAAIASGQLIARKWNRRTIVLDDDLAAFMRNLPAINGNDRHTAG
jgi:hypothetical protein